MPDLPVPLRTDFVDGEQTRHLASHHNVEYMKVNSLIEFVRDRVPIKGRVEVTASTYDGEPIDMGGKTHVDVELDADCLLDLDMSSCDMATVMVHRPSGSHTFALADTTWLPGGHIPITDPAAGSRTLFGTWSPDDGQTKYGLHQQMIYAVPFGLTGGVDLSTMNGTIPDFPIDVPHRLLSYVFRLKTATTGQALILDANWNGSTIFTNQANRPTFAVGQTRSTLTMPSTTLLVPSGGVEGLLGVDIDQVGGSGGRGRGLSGIFKFMALF